MSKKLALLLFLLLLLFPALTLARTTPEDILNAKRETFNQKLKNYSDSSKQKLEEFSKKIADLNKSQTARLDQLTTRQGEILDEYLRRQGALERQGDGISRNLEDPVENARYWITYAHEAVAFQAAKIYIFELTGESNLKKDIIIQINALNADMNILSGKVNKSQKILEQLLEK